MSEASEYIFCDEYATEIDTAKSGRCHIMYRRADLPATDAQAMRNEKVKALVKAADKADKILSAVSDGKEIYESAIADLRTALAQLKEGQKDV